uniref:GTD-binding domain-containing protein n=1 Tax=Kalanchoe fedtschenkoi TaxID=63787 RepID=A0A7N0US27_KALFE
MAESGVFSGKSGADMTALKEALNAQQQLLHKLHAELDQEREASETAASEALSMILRLQGEKAAVEMEAKQYKRMAEEKMFHADECLAIFEDVIYQKDMEIAALECQIQAYKYKLLSFGCSDIDCSETKSPESVFLQKIESLCGEGTSNGEDVKRSSLLPPAYPMGLAEREKARGESLAWAKNENLFEDGKSIGIDQEFKVGSADAPDIETYWQQIRKLDERVKGISNAKDFGWKSRRNSLGGLFSPGGVNALNSCLDAVKKQPEILQPSKTMDDSGISSGVQDIFEVPEASVTRNAGGKRKIEPDENTPEGENRLEKPDSPTVIKSLFKAEPKAAFNLSPESRLFKTSGRKNLDHYNLACAHSAITSAESKLEIGQLSRRLERLEQATKGANSRPEITPLGADDFGSLKELLSQIQTQLGTIQSDIKSLKISKSKKQDDDSAIRAIQEEMLHFWL